MGYEKKMAVKCDEVSLWLHSQHRRVVRRPYRQEHQRKVDAAAPLAAQEACNNDEKCGGLYDKGALEALASSMERTLKEHRVPE